MSDVECEHKFVHLRKVNRSRFADYATYYELTDVFFCEKCLREERKTKREHVAGRGNPPPDWYAP